MEISQEDIDQLHQNMFNLNMNPGEEIIDVIPQEYIIDGEEGIKHPIGMLGNTLEAKKFIVATGSSLAFPDVPGLKDAAMTTDDLLDMTRAPASVLICRADFIEVEMANILATFGCKVVLATEAPRILAREDHDTSQRVAQALREQGVDYVVTSSRVRERILAAAADYPAPAESYRRLDAEAELVKEFRPGPGERGPVLKLYRL